MNSRSRLVLQLLEELFQSATLTLQNSSLKPEKLAAHQCIWSTEQDKGRDKEVYYYWLLQPATGRFDNSCPNYRGK